MTMQNEHKTSAISGKPWTARRIHLWISVLLAIPMALIAISGILISLRSVTKVSVPLRWLSAETVPERLPINAFAHAADGSSWIGNSQGLFRVADAKAEPVPGFEGQEVIAITFRPGDTVPVVATRMAVWEKAGDTWAPVRRGRVRQLTTLPDGQILAISGGRGELAAGNPFVSNSAGNWKPFMPAMKANAALPRLENPRVSLQHFMRELHSGAYFLGKGPGEMIWSNIMGWVLVSLTLTGLWMWLRAEVVKARKRVAKRAGKRPVTMHPVSVAARKE